MQWLQEEFLPYLDEWERSVHQREGYSAKEKQLIKVHVIDVKLCVYNFTSILYAVAARRILTIP